MLITYLSPFLNNYAINLAIIVSSILTYYFLSLGKAVKRAEFNKYDRNLDIQNIFNWKETFLSSIFLAISSTFLSYNTIPAFNKFYSLDTSYILIYLAIIFGTPLLGLFTTVIYELICTLLLLKLNVPFDLATLSQHISFVVMILLISYYLKHSKISMFKKHFFFLISYLILKSAFYYIYVEKFYEPQITLEITHHLCVYTSIFLITTTIITKTVSLTNSFLTVQTAASTDGLTKALNRFSFDHEISRLEALRPEERQSFNLSIIDIDNFKIINDSYGHQAGDQALIYLANLLTKCDTHQNIEIYRSGGDEFTLIHHQDFTSSEQFYNTLFTALEDEPFKFNNQSIQIVISVGISTISDTVNFNSSNIISNTDNALYTAKKASGNKLVKAK